MSNEISIITEGDQIFVKTPYSSDFVADAKHRLGGRWNPPMKAWVFRKKDEVAVREVVRKHYGTDGTEQMDVVDVLVRVGTGGLPLNVEVLEGLGRHLLRKIARDGYPKFYDGVSLYSGPDFPNSAGSRKYPILGHDARVLMVRDVPRATAERYMREAPQIYSLLAPEDERTAYFREREKLLARLAELNQLLGLGVSEADSTSEEDEDNA